jgi:hypothetical protein
MEDGTTHGLDPLALSAFAGSLVNLPKEEIRKAKRLYLLNAITEFQAQRATRRTMMIVFGCMSIIPIFLIIFIPALLTYRIGIQADRQKILNAMEVWREDLGPDFAEIQARLA